MGTTLPSNHCSIGRGVGGTSGSGCPRTDPTTTFSPWRNSVGPLRVHTLLGPSFQKAAAPAPTTHSYGLCHPASKWSSYWSSVVVDRRAFRARPAASRRLCSAIRGIPPGVLLWGGSFITRAGANHLLHVLNSESFIRPVGDRGSRRGLAKLVSCTPLPIWT